MDNLNKQQVVLLTLLVSFVTSIATGITTVSLLGQSQQTVTQTINRVVEKTIEKVAPSTGGSQETTTVVVKEEDLTIDSIDKNAKSIVRIKGVASDTGLESFLGLGVVISKEGQVIFDKNKLVQGMSFVAVFNDGTSIPLDVSTVKENETLALLKVKSTPSGFTFTPAIFQSKTDLIKLGQSVILLSGKEKNSVATGIISSLNMKDDVDSQGKPIKTLSSIETDIKQDSIITGSILLNLSGDIVGVKYGEELSVAHIFVSGNQVKNSIANLLSK